jgi:hypothetical protein
MMVEGGASMMKSKSLTLCFIVISLMLLFVGTEMALGFPDIFEFPAFFSQPLVVPTVSLTTGDILVDNFEYWDSPYNHGWIQMEPVFPVFGFGMGYATIFNTILDLQHGSRVLDVYRPASVFLLGTTYEKHAILYNLFTPNGNTYAEGIDMKTNGIVSFNFRAPLGIELWDIFELDVICQGNGDTITLRLFPLQPDAGTPGAANSTEGMYPMTADVVFDEGGQTVIDVRLGRGLLDGSWHAVWVDLVEAIHLAYDEEVPADPGDYRIQQADAVMVSGQMFRFDNLMFRTSLGHVLGDYPDLFEMGPLYAQIYEPYRYLFIADYAGAGHPGSSITEDRVIDLMLDPNNFITDPNAIIEAWFQDSNVGGVIQIDPNYLDPNHPDYGGPEPYYSGILGRDFSININLPVFSDPNMRMGGALAKEVREETPLGWNATIGSYGASGVQSYLLEPLSIYPSDGMPTYFPAYYAAIDLIKTYGKPFYPPEIVFIFESALWNSGVAFWPNIAALDYTPQVFEDLIVTIEVTNGLHSDVRTFPISVVNYPMENYAPVLQLDIDDQIFYVGEGHEYIMNFIDPDCFIFSRSAIPATTHVPGFPISSNFRKDMEDLRWQMTVNGLPSYQFGPWIQKIIDQCSGLITWVPQFEGVFETFVTCTDNRGASGFGEITIFAVNKGTWLNHPPIIQGGPSQPVVLRAGEEFILHTPNFTVEDPDGDEIYASCNIGSCGRAPSDNFIWTFQTNFPGSYLVEIVFYDIRGGYAVMEFFVDVKPWWSY